MGCVERRHKFPFCAGISPYHVDRVDCQQERPWIYADRSSLSPFFEIAVRLMKPGPVSPDLYPSLLNAKREKRAATGGGAHSPTGNRKKGIVEQSQRLPAVESIDACSQRIHRHRTAVKTLEPGSQEAEGPVEPFILRNRSVAGKETRAVWRILLGPRKHDQEVFVLPRICLVMARRFRRTATERRVSRGSVRQKARAINSSPILPEPTPLAIWNARIMDKQQSYHRRNRSQLCCEEFARQAKQARHCSHLGRYSAEPTLHGRPEQTGKATSVCYSTARIPPKRALIDDGALQYRMHTEDLLTPKPEGASVFGEGDGKGRESASWKSSEPSWRGDLSFLLFNLIAKDFKVRYRNMSLGVFWSLLNPLVLMGVLTFVFTKVTRNNSVPHFPAFVMCGLVPFNFFSIGWTSGTTSLVDNAAIIKRVPIPREIVPLASVVSNCLHLLIQIFLLLALVVASGLPVTRSWMWLPYLWAMEIVFVCGLSLVTSAVNVYVRDTRYVVESINTVMFWAVPVVYSFSVIPSVYAEIYKLNPLAALILAMRDILLEGHSPRWELLVKLTLVAAFTFVFGLALFQRLKRRFYDHL